MDRLADHLVAWHNRHPLARRITAADVHTVGIVALPFLRSMPQPGGPIEPVLTEAVAPAAAADPAEPAATPTATSAGASAPAPGLLARLTGLLPRRLRAGGPPAQRPAFSERFLPGLSAARVARFASAHGFAEPPANREAMPWRVIDIDASLPAPAGGGWPFELYLLSAGIDAGGARTRVLAGRGHPPEVAGSRLWDPRRLALAAALLTALLGAAAGTWWALRPAPASEPPAMAAAASAAASSAPAAAEPAVPAASEAAPALAAEPASAAEAGAQADSAAAAASEPQAAASEPVPDIRPHLVQRADGKQLPPLRAQRAGDASSPAGGDRAGPADGGKDAARAIDARADPSTPVGAATPPKARPEGEDKADRLLPADPRLAKLAQSPARSVVALVGPAGTKAEAEAMLKKMQAGLVGVHSNPDSLQADVLQTPDGWRATIWPFPSREQAQLINATLVARGMKTRAVDF